MLQLSIFVFLALLDAFFFFAVFRLKERSKEALLIASALQEHGIIVEGRIEQHSHPFFLFVPVLIYSYEHQGRIFQGKHLVSMKDYRILANGAEVQVRYIPSDPEQATLEDIASVANNASYFQNLMRQYWSLGITFLGLLLFLLVTMFMK